MADVDILWWMWLLFGLGLSVLELLLPTFFILWFAIGAVFVSIVMLFDPGLSPTWQVSLWVLFSSITTVFWFKVLRPRRADTRWTAEDVIGEVGLLTTRVGEFEKGKVRFQKPVLGSEVWTCISDQSLASGDRVRVVAVEGNTVRVIQA